jgi:outer membrane receptor protein involved in Fe transport
MNYKTGKFNFYGGIDWSDRVSPSTGTESRETYRGDTTDFRNNTFDQAWLRHGLNFKAGMDYYLSDNITLSVGGEYGSGGFGWDRFRKVHEFTTPAGNDRYYLDNNVFRWERNYYSLNASYLQKFKQQGHELRVFAFFSGRDGSQKQDKRETETDQNWNPATENPYRLRSTEAGPSRGYRVEVDYIKPVLENGKFEAGYHFRLDDDEEDYFLETFDYDRMAWIEDDRYTKYSTFDRSIHAVYGIFGQEIGSFQYQVGLRGEYTYRDIRVTNTNERSLVDRFNYFPSVHLSYRMKEKNQFMASYSRRIERPRSWYLEPFVTYIDESTRRIGNPSLLPEYTDSYELGYLRTLESGTFTAEAYFRDTRNAITWINYYDQELGYFINTARNLNKERALGIESSFVYDITSWLNLNLSGTYYYFHLEDLTGESTELRSSNNWDGRVMASFKLPSQTQFQLNTTYDSPTVTAQGRAEGSWYMDFTAKQEFLKKSLSITLKVADIFASRKRESYSYGPGFYAYEYNQPESRVVSLTISYRLNNFKKNAALQNMGGNGGGM